MHSNTAFEDVLLQRETDDSVAVFLVSSLRVCVYVYVGWGVTLGTHHLQILHH